ncbi:MAG: D-aminoacyl-tRNA deacylase, partial [Cetobacterium sp.]
MRAVIQRVTNASVTVEDKITGKINHGFLVLLGVTHSDTEKDVEWLAKKITDLRVFNDSDDKMNLG